MKRQIVIQKCSNCFSYDKASDHHGFCRHVMHEVKSNSYCNYYYEYIREFFFSTDLERQLKENEKENTFETM